MAGSSETERRIEMRTFFKAGLLLMAAPLLGAVPAQAAVVPSPPALRGEVTATTVTECDYGVCDGTMSLWRDGRIQVVRVTPEATITTGGNHVLLVEVRPGGGERRECRRDRKRVARPGSPPGGREGRADDQRSAGAGQGQPLQAGRRR